MCRNYGASRNRKITYCASMSVSVVYIFALRGRQLLQPNQKVAAGATPQAGTLRTGYWTDGITFYYQFSQ